jgi:UPF0755 protein
MVDMRREPYSDDAEALSARLHSSLNRTSPRSPSEALQPEPVPPPPPRSRAVRHPMVVFLNVFITVVVVAILVGGGGIFFAKSRFDGASTLDTARSFTVARGSGLNTIADDLVKDGLADTKWLFVFGVWLSNQTSNLKAGEYLIPAHASMRDIMDAMVTGKGILYSVTIPEGLTSQQIVDRLKAEDVLGGDIKQIPGEGSLLPETYKFTRATPARTSSIACRASATGYSPMCGTGGRRICRSQLRRSSSPLPRSWRRRRRWPTSAAAWRRCSSTGSS